MTLLELPEVLPLEAAEQLRQACGGATHLPGDPGYDAARGAWQANVDQRPAAVLYPACEREVVAAVRAATAAGLRIVAQSTGHNASPLPALNGAALLRTSALNDVTVDADRGTVRVGAGALWMDVVEPVAATGHAVLHGSSPDVGVAGYSLGGGIGWYARKYGLQTNQLTAVELVTADGRLIRADRDHHPELFWALRGGGGNFGVVTAFEFPTLPIRSAYAGWLVWDWHRAADVLPAWLEWTRHAPDEVTTSLRILQLPPIEAVPEPLRGKQIVAIDGAVLASDDDAAAMLAPLRALRPEMDTFTRMPAPALVRLHGDPEGPTPGISASVNLGTAAVEDAAAFAQAFVAAAGPDSGSPLLLAELRQLGGALGRPHPGGGAVSMLDGAFVLLGLGMPMAPGDAEAIHAHAQRLVSACRPWSNGRNYLNFTEEPVDASRAYDAETLARLAAVRAAYDPAGVFLANHPLT